MIIKNPRNLIKDIAKQYLGITTEDLHSYQFARGTSLIHRCCGREMERIENLDFVNQGEFYLCQESC